MTAEQQKTLDDRAAELLAEGQAKTIHEAKLLAKKEQLQAEVERTKKSISDYRAKLRKKAAERRRKREARGKIVLGAAILKAGLAEIDYESNDEKEIIIFKHGFNENSLINALSGIANKQTATLTHEEKILTEIGREIILTLKKDSEGRIIKEKGIFGGVISAKRIELIKQYVELTSMPFIEIQNAPKD